MNSVTEGFLKRNSLFIAKLIALIALFFVLTVWLYFAYAPSIRRMAPSMLYRVAVTEEFARLDSLGSFLSALFQGNLGYSFLSNEPVWSILAGSLGTTVLLIIISIAISGATGAFVGLVALRFKPKGHMPLVSAYSLRGYFFALTMWTGVILFLFFSYYLGWFPSAHSQPNYWLIYPPENILIEIEGRLRHLVLPMLTLTIIFMIRSLFVVWSGGAHFTSGKTLRNLLLPLTTTDFACIVSAVVLIEYTFLLPGVGWQLLAGGDLNVMAGAFIVLLAIAIILGYVGVFFDFVKQRYGLLEESEKEAHARAENEERPTQNVSNMRLKNLLGLLLRRKSLFLGVVIVCSFVTIGIAAPLLTPYDPVSIMVYPKIAYRLSKPTWYKHLFPAENLSENIDAISDPYFKSAEAVESLRFEAMLAHQGVIHAEYVSDKGSTEGSGPGCMAVVFEREADVAPFGEVRANLTAAFNYPYSFPPQQFLGHVAVLIDDPQNISTRINVVLEKTGSSRRISWTRENLTLRAGGWITSHHLIDSNSPYLKDWLGERFPASAMFSESGDYRFSVEVVFEDAQPGVSSVTVYVDDFFLRLYGNSFGLLGTDEYGRDVFSQVLYGARNTLITAVPTAVVAALIGLALGFAASHFGNLTDNMVRLFVDTTLALPIVPLLAVAFWTLWPSPLDLALLWVLSALAGMASRSAYLAHTGERILAGGALRSRFPSLFKDLSANFCLVMTSLTLLNLIGSFGLYQLWPGLDFYAPTWSGMLGSALSTVYLFDAWWLWVPPLSCILLLAAGFLLIGLGLEKRL